MSSDLDTLLSQLRGVASLASSEDIDGETDNDILRAREIVDVEHGCAGGPHGGTQRSRAGAGCCAMPLPT